MLVSDHGNGPMTDRAIYLNAWLERQGLLHLKEVKRSPKMALASLIAKAGRGGKELLYSRLPFQTLTKVRALFPDRARRVLAAASLAKVDWSRTKAFSEEMRGNIWINLAGRDPQGIVEPEEYEGLRELIIERLSEIQDPETGVLLIKAVHRREELYCGPFVERFPDLVVEAEIPDTFRPWHDPQEVEPVTILRREELRQLKTSGCHRMNGILLARGPKLRAGVKIEGGSLVDIAPTILYLMGESVPTDMDGRVLAELVEPEFLKQNPIRYVEPGGDTALPGKRGYSDQEAERIKRQLEGLGYLG
jgi:predicted AlkP superfamily phosphohydrolase/phosphomutase